jgi:DNA repair protein RecO (recombination protein O)
LKQRSDEAYVLRTRALSDADLIVSLLAQQHGQVRGVARSARRSRRRFGGWLEPLTHVRAFWVEKPGRELHRLESVQGLRSFAEMQADPIRQAACAVLAELTEAFTQQGQAETRYFRLLGAVLVALEGGASPDVMLRYFEFWTLRLHGLLPDLRACSACHRELGAAERPRVELRSGLLCRTCDAKFPRRGRQLTQRDRELLESLRTQRPEQMPRTIPASRRGGAVEILLRGTLESFAERPLRTYKHLKTALHPGGGGSSEV